MKRILAAVLAVLTAASLSACEQKGPSAFKAEPLYCAVRNNIELIELPVHYSEYGWADRVYFEISGLKNKEVQAQINKEIKDRFDKTSDWSVLPKYRGIQRAVGDVYIPDEDSVTVYANEYYNCSNILSLHIHSGKMFRGDEAYNYVYAERSDTYNIDLNTGKALKLADLFADSAAGIDYINEQIREAISRTDLTYEHPYMYEPQGLSVVGHFDGVSEDQKFFIDANGRLVLIFDYDTPWVYIDDFGARYFAVDISGIRDFHTKFKSAESLFEDDTENYLLMCLEESDSDCDRDVGYQFQYGGFDIFYEKDVALSAGASEAEIRDTAAFVDEFQLETDSLVEYMRTLNDNNRDNDFHGHSFCYIKFNKAGRFTNVARHYVVYMYDDLGGNTLCDKEKNSVTVYKDGQPVSFAQLFVPGFDYKSLLIDAGADMEEYYFSLGSSAIYLNSMNEDYITFEDSITLEYSDIACENLTIFE